MRKVYLVMKNADLTEGRGPMLVEAVVDNEADAKLIAVENEPYRQFGQFCEVKIMPVLSNSSEYIKQKKIEAIARAKAKLTREERVLLGLL